MRSADPAAVSAEVAACLDRYRRNGEVEELDRALGLCRASGRSPGALSNLATVLYRQFEARGVRSDLDEARSVLVTLARSGPVTTYQISLLARIALDLYELDADEAELERAIGTARLGLAKARDESVLTDLNHTLGSALVSRYELTGQLADLDEAVCAYRASADADRGPSRLARLVNLVRQTRRRIGLTAPPANEDLAADAIAAADEVAKGFPGDHPVHGEMLQSAGVLLRYRYEATGDPNDLRQAVRRLRRAVSLPVERPGQRADRVASLSAALFREFQITGDTGLLNESIEGHRRALAATPAGDRDKPARLNNLAAALRERAVYFDDIDALREAIALLRESVALSGDPRERAVVAGTLGVALQDLFARTWDPATADEAVACARESVRFEGQNLGTQRLALANALMQTHMARGDPANLAEALRLLHDLVEQQPTGTPVRGLCLGALGRAWNLEFERTDDLEALDRAITAMGRATRADAITGNVRARWHRMYAELLLIQHDRVRAPGPLRAAVDAFAAAATEPASTPSNQVLTANQWAAAAVQLRDWSTALRAAEVAMSMFPEVASRRLARTDREHGIARLAGVAADAAACALHSGDAELAVRWLEQGRGVLLGQALDARTDIGQLRRQHPDAAARLSELDEALAVLDLAEAGSDQRHAIAGQREALLGEIRTIPGFAEFLLPPSIARVHGWAGAGPVVLVNVSHHRCDALVLIGGRIVVIPLPGLTFADASRNSERFAEALEASSEPGREQEGRRVIAEILTWLDDAVTGPVLARLACDGVRVWWSPGGPLASLPLHAAGHPGNAVLDRVVSSYTPTVRALGHARSVAARPIGSPGMLVVAVPEPESAPPLPRAYQEVTAIGELWPATALSGAAATAERVIEALAHHGYVHFACHGVHEAEDPSTSRLLLHDRTLTVLEVSRVHLPDARLAVLSACHTAHGAARVADEALHLAGAFQLAGYPSVVATLWQVNDMMATRIACAFHTALASAGLPPPPDRASTILHQVLHQFRDYPPSIWASWVHSGA